MSAQTAIEIKREALRARYMSDANDRFDGQGDKQVASPPLYTGGVDHLALICSDISATVQFYTQVLKMQLTRVVPNRDEPTSTHVFLDMGGGNRLAFFDFPNSGVGKAVRGVGGMHHVALKATAEHYQAVLVSLDEHGVAHSVHNGAEHDSVYFRDPDDILVEVTTGH